LAGQKASFDSIEMMCLSGRSGQRSGQSLLCRSARS
jgi:hypothetical protein